MLADLWTRKAPEIRRAAKRTLRDNDAAEDVTARSFLRLAERLEAGYIPDDTEGLLGVIAHGLIVDEKRAAFRRPLPAGLDVVEPGITSYFPLGRASFHDEFNDALRALPDEQRDAFILTELRGLTVREAADILGVHYATVSRHSEAASTSLREELR